MFALKTDDLGADSRAGRVHLNGNVARRKFATSGFLWDLELPGFALRHTRGGSKTWLVQYRHRRDIVRVSLGKIEEITAPEARAKARTLLAEAALDGLPSRPHRCTAEEFVPIFWAHNASRWKPLTQRANRGYIVSRLVPAFGSKELGELARADVTAWRDSMASLGGAFNRAIPVLAAMLSYSETLGYRPPGTNFCKRIPRYKRARKERYLSARDFQRLGDVLRENSDQRLTTSAIWLLIYTGARRSEITGLLWEWVRERYIDLPDSKTGPKRVHLNQGAVSVLDRLGRQTQGPIFPPGFPRLLDLDWAQFRATAGLRDVRLPDLSVKYRISH